ncbi:MAG: metallophosphoesterase [Opitutaceae bacterium]|nr:metallophosphoesterase [Cephaloticoccus sp.]MCP5530593.1 metallophosphoesterase [Opitutaceae bacterium]
MPPRRPAITRRRFLTSVGAAALATGLYTWRVEPHWLEITYRELRLPHLPSDLNGRTLVQISDLHIGQQVSDDYLLSAFARVRELRPDFVVHTGDLVTFDSPSVQTQAEKVMADFPTGRLGTFGILGNHDYGSNWNLTHIAHANAAILARAGCLPLRNTLTESHGLIFAGLDDYWSPNFAPEKVLRNLPHNRAIIVMSHNPDTCDLPGLWDDFQGWVLAGHTHGGQCKPPFLPPPLLPVKNKRYTAGAFAFGPGRQVYINRGVGHLLQVRFNVRPEITCFTLRPA